MTRLMGMVMAVMMVIIVMMVDIMVLMQNMSGQNDGNTQCESQW